MTQPPVELDLVTAAYQRLAAFPDFQSMVLNGLIGTDAASAALDSEKLAKAWLFQGLDDEGRPFRDPEGSGTSVVVLAEHNEWTGPNRHNTAFFPRLQILIYTDSTRAANGAVGAQDARRKTKHIAKRLDRCFHLVGNDVADQVWGDRKWVHSSVRSSPLSIRDVPGTQSQTVRCEMVYDTMTD